MPRKQGEPLSRGPSCSPTTRAIHTRSFLLSQERTLWHPKWPINRKPRGLNHFSGDANFAEASGEKQQSRDASPASRLAVISG
jgi:hypothetical protein